tara:strand:+ start:815 stop:1432 length:618 start_codon:yes stop_codon:yes gene_type:complete
MAYTSRDFLRDLAIYSTGAAVGVKNSVKFAQYAAKKGIQLAGVGVARTAPVAGRGLASLAKRNPVGFGAGLGLAALETPPGEALLEMAAERGAADRRALEQAIDERIFRATRAAESATMAAKSPMFQRSVKSAVKRKASKYSRAVKAGMKAVKKSKFDGKRGTIKNPKKTFATVNKVVSAVNKGKKVATKGVRGTIARAARRIFK